MNDTVERNEIVQFKDGDFVLDVNISPDSETVWLNQKQIASLFGIDRDILKIFLNQVNLMKIAYVQILHIWVNLVFKNIM